MSRGCPPGAARGAAGSRAAASRPARAPPPRGTLRPAPGAARPPASGGCRRSTHTLWDTNTIQHEPEIVHACPGRAGRRRPGSGCGGRRAPPASPTSAGGVGLLPSPRDGGFPWIRMDAATLERCGTEHIGSMHVQTRTQLVSLAAKRLDCRMSCNIRQPLRAWLRLGIGSGSVGVGPCSSGWVDRMAGSTRRAHRSRRARPGRLAPVGTARGAGSPAKARALAPASHSRNPGLRTRCRIRAARPRS